MAHHTRRIGLSLGADLCWPAAYESIVRKLDLTAKVGRDTVDFAVERVTVEPFDLQQPCRYDIVLDRLTHWFHTSREWVKKAVILDGLYVLNNPWSLQSMEKHTSYAALMKLDFPVPKTWLVPPKKHTPSADLAPTLSRYARLFDIGRVGEELGYPMFMKPYDGGGWEGVVRIRNEDELRAAYERSGTHVMHLQEAIDPHDIFVRTIGIGPQVHVVRYDPSAPLHGRYTVDFHFIESDDWQYLTDQQLIINSMFGWEFNSCESLRRDGVWHPIDFANACPDFQVTSLHYHFPDMVKKMVRWSLFCAARNRTTPVTLDWEPYFKIAKKDLPFEERMAGYTAIARKRFDVDRFEQFCDDNLGDLDEVVWEFFGTDEARALVKAKVEALYPAHEIEQFTNHFWGLIQFWRKTEADRMNGSTP